MVCPYGIRQKSTYAPPRKKNHGEGSAAGQQLRARFVPAALLYLHGWLPSVFLELEIGQVM
jgi:hypothetical protein